MLEQYECFVLVSTFYKYKIKTRDGVVCMYLIYTQYFQDY